MSRADLTPALSYKEREHVLPLLPEASRLAVAY
jgi:hypothetical protein